MIERCFLWRVSTSLTIVMWSMDNTSLSDLFTPTKVVHAAFNQEMALLSMFTAD